MLTVRKGPQRPDFWILSLSAPQLLFLPFIYNYNPSPFTYLNYVESFRDTCHVMIHSEMSGCYSDCLLERFR
ncbi:hypothetical protein Hdeb2414_s0189g00827871 [Helianthus debilis subsp. tardiflorus]